MKRPGTGVVIGRFQTHDLHEGHHALIREADKHQRLMVLVGVAPQLVTPSDPLDYHAREQMIRESYPHAVVLPLQDIPGSNALWSTAADRAVSGVFPLDRATLYFGRGSSRKLYSGRCTVAEIDEVPHLSATDIRADIGKQVGGSAAWRAGVIYAAHNMWGRSMPVVDIAIVRPSDDGMQMLLGSRNSEPGLYRLPGGHVDVKDENYEAAARREALEETGLEISDLHYVGSFKCKSAQGWAMFTTLYVAQYVFGPDQASDDLDRLRWVSFDKLGKLAYADTHALLTSAAVNAWNNMKETLK